MCFLCLLASSLTSFDYFFFLLTCIFWSVVSPDRHITPVCLGGHTSGSYAPGWYLPFSISGRQFAPRYTSNSFLEKLHPPSFPSLVSVLLTVHKGNAPSCTCWILHISSICQSCVEYYWLYCPSQPRVICRFNKAPRGVNYPGQWKSLKRSDVRMDLCKNPFSMSFHFDNRW